MKDSNFSSSTDNFIETYFVWCENIEAGVGRRFSHLGTSTARSTKSFIRLN